MTDPVPQAPRSTTPSPVGRQLGAYQVLSLLGVGGMGEVYRARDTKLERDVAIKVLPPLLRRRLRAAAPLRARGADAGRAQPSSHWRRSTASKTRTGVRALVLELIEGETLADRIQRGPGPCPWLKR